MGLLQRFKNGWNVFVNGDKYVYMDHGPTYSSRPYSNFYSVTNEDDIVTTIYNRIAVDASNILIRHCYVDENNNFVAEKDSYLNDCFKWQTNIDQIPSAFIHDVVMSLFDEGVVAIVPVDTNTSPDGSFDVESLRVGKIVSWAPRDVCVELYDDRFGVKKNVWVSKYSTAIVENPFYYVMNGKNSTLGRLRRKLQLIDKTDENNLGTGKLDVFIQVPYDTRSSIRKKQATERLNEIEDQMMSRRYGIAYISSNEKVVQLNRPAENNLLAQVDKLIEDVYSKLSITVEILNGTADEKTMNNYYSRTVEVILSAIVDSMKCKFLSRTARTQMQTLKIFRDPFQLIPTSSLPDIVDKFTRNEILTSNEVRGIMGYRPSSDPRADELRNKNIAAPPDENPTNTIEDFDEGDFYEE